MFEAFVVSVVAELAKADPLTVIASASKVPSISASPDISKEPAINLASVPLNTSDELLAAVKNTNHVALSS